MNDAPEVSFTEIKHFIYRYQSVFALVHKQVQYNLTLNELKGYLKTGTILRQNQIWAFTVSQAKCWSEVEVLFSSTLPPIQENWFEPNLDLGTRVHILYISVTKIYTILILRVNFGHAKQEKRETDDTSSAHY